MNPLHMPNLDLISSRTRALTTSIASLLLGLAAASHAQLYFDANGSSADSGTPGTFAWDTGTNWTTDITGLAAPTAWVDGSAAVFSAGAEAAGTWRVAISGVVHTNSIGFTGTANTIHNIEGGVIDFGTDMLTIDSSAAGAGSGRSKNISSAIIGTGSVILTVNGDQSNTGGGSNTIFTLSGANTFTGGVFINSGVVSAASNFGDISNVVTLNGGGLVANVNTTLNRDLVIEAGGGILRSYGAVTNFTLAGKISGTGAITRTDGGTAIFTGDLSEYSGFFNQNAGNAVFESNSSMTGMVAINAGTLWVGNSGTTGSLKNASGIMINAGSLYIRRSDTVNASDILPSTITFAAGSNFEFNPTVATGVLNVDRDLGSDITVGQVRVSGGTMNFLDGTEVIADTISIGLQTATNRGTLNIGSGSLVNTRYFNIGANGNNSGTIHQTGGTVNIFDGGTGFRLGHWTNGTNPGSSYVLSGGTLDALGMAINAGDAQVINIGWDGTGEMTVGGGTGAATLKTVGIQFDRNRAGTGFSASSLTVSPQGIVEIGSRGLIGQGTNDGVILNGGVLVATAESNWSAAIQANTGTTSVIELNGFAPTITRSITGTGAIELSDSVGAGRLNFDSGTGTQTVSAVLAGTTPFSKSGTGTLVLSANNTSTGTFFLNAGTLSVPGFFGGIVAAADGTSVAGEGIIGQLDFGIAVGANLIVDPTTPGALTVGGNVTFHAPTNVVFSRGPGIGALIPLFSHGGALSGLSNLSVYGAQYYRGAAISENSGVVSVQITNKSLTWNGLAGGEWDTATSARWNAGEADAFYWGDHVRFDDTGINLVVSILSEVQPGAITVDSSTQNYVIGGSTGGFISGGASLLKDGSSILTVNGPNTFVGGTVISEGSIHIQTPGALGTGSVTLGDANTGNANIGLYLKPVDDSAGARIDFPSQVIVSSNGTGTVTLGSTPTAAGANQNHSFLSIILQRDVIFDSSAWDRTDYENISGTGNITVAGPGRSIFMTPNFFVGNVTVSTTGTGTLQLGTNSTAFNAIPDTSSVTVSAGAIFNLSYSANGTETIGGLFGSGTVGNNGGNANTLIVGGGNASGDFSGIIRNGGAGAFGFTKIGAGTQILSGMASTYTGVTSIAGGILSIAALANGGVASPIGQSAKAGTNLILNGGTLQYTGASVVADRAFQTGANGGGIEITDPTATVTFGSDATPFALAGTLTKSGPGTLRFERYGTTTASTAAAANDMVINEGVVEFGTTYFNFSPFGYRTLNIAVNPGAILRTTTAHALGGDNIDAGNSWGQIRLSGGVFQVNGSQYISGGTVNGVGRLVLDGGIVEGTADLRALNSTVTTLPSTTTSEIRNAGGISLQYGGLTFDVADGVAATDLLVSNVMTSTNGITKNGAGTLELTGASTYIGATTINAGTLLVNGSITGATTVMDGILDGSGAIGSVTLNDGTLTAGGSSIESLATGNLDLFGGTLRFDLDATGGSDQLITTGAVNFNGQTQLALAFTSDLPDQTTFTLLANDDLDGFSFASGGGLYLGEQLLSSGADFTYINGEFTEIFQVNFAGGDGNDLTLTAIPEPAGATLLLAGLGALIGTRRRRARA